MGVPRLLVIGEYRMGFEITQQGTASVLRVVIDDNLPETPLARWLGDLLAASYARWCTRNMADDAAKRFA